MLMANDSCGVWCHCLKYSYIVYGIRYISKDTELYFGRAYRGLNGGFLLLRNFNVATSVSPHVCFILVLILISMFLR